MIKNVNLIIGSGVIGAYLAKLLISKKQQVIVTSRKNKKNFKNYKYLKIQNKVKFVKLDVTKTRAIEKVLDKYEPGKIFYFAGQSSIPKSILLPQETYNSHYLGTKNFLEVLKIAPFNPKYISKSLPIIRKKKTPIPVLNSGFKNENKKSILTQTTRKSPRPNTSDTELTCAYNCLILMRSLVFQYSATKGALTLISDL